MEILAWGKAGAVGRGEIPAHLCNVDDRKPIRLRRRSLYRNDYLYRWPGIGVQASGDRCLGEVCFAEAHAPTRLE